LKRLEDYLYYEEKEPDLKIYHGDCLEIMPLMPKIDLVVTDPPYAIPTIVASLRETTINIGDLSLVESTFRNVFEKISCLVGDSGRMFVFCDGTSYPVIFRSAYGQWKTALLIWKKQRIGMGREFRKMHELILHAWKDKTPIFKDGIGRADVIECNSVGQERQHPAQKPTELLKEFFRVQNGTVLDPFLGSGTTLVACKERNRSGIGIEINEKYCEIAKTRLRATTKSLF